MYNREVVISKLEFMLEEIIHRSNGDHRKEKNSPEAGLVSLQATRQMKAFSWIGMSGRKSPNKWLRYLSSGVEYLRCLSLKASPQ